jgi:molybdate ABC transporter permease protein
VILPADLSPLLISLATTSAATVATFFLGLMAAWGMHRSRNRPRMGGFKAWIDGILTLPLVLPPTVVGYFLLLLFGRRSPIGRVLEMAGVSIVFSWPATVIAATVVAFPLMYRTSLGALEQVNARLLDAARTLGASEWRVFRRVHLPLAAPGILAGTVLAFARALGEFGATLMFAGNIPGRTQTLPIAIFSSAEAGDMRGAAVWVVVIVVLSLAIIRLLHREGAMRKPWRKRATEPKTAKTTEIQAEPGMQMKIVGDAKTASLEIEIEKRLENFTLNVQMTAGRGARGLLGPSGAGKSMTLRLIAGVAAPDRGRIVLNGRTLFDGENSANEPPARRRIGVVFQDYALFPHMTVEENVGFGLHELARGERERRVQWQLERMHISELAGRYPDQISGGQRQRVAIARSMAIEPEALLLDEPFAALDPHLRRQMEERLRADLAGFSGVVVFVTHDMEEAFRFCSDLTVLSEGRVLASGPRQQLFENPRSVAAAQLTGCKNIAGARRVDDQTIEVPAWECRLRLAASSRGAIGHVGYRSHHLRFEPDGFEPEHEANVFACWLIETSEAPHETTLYLRLHRAPLPGDAPHLQADLPKEAWRALSGKPQPWKIQLDPARLLLLED